MTIGTVTFYKMPCSLSSGEYPVMNASTNLDTYKVKAIQSVKYTFDMAQTLKVPYFSEYTTVNIVRLGASGPFYWITSYKANTLSNPSITFGLDICPELSLLTAGSTGLKGIWKRRPDITDNLREPVSSTGMYVAGLPQKHAANDLPSWTYSNGLKVQLYWLEMTVKVTNDGLERYGMFVSVAPEEGVVYRYSYFTYYANNLAYPTITKVINDVYNTMGLPASDIVNISISKRCPFKYGQDTANHYIYLVNNSDNQILASKSHTYSGTTYTWYDIDSDGSLTGGIIPAAGVSGTMDLSVFQHYCGQYSIVDEMGNKMTAIDPSNFSQILGGYRVAVTWRTVSDYTGIYTIATVGGQPVIFPEGHLPWSGDVWDTYRAYSMNSDRQAVENAKEIARRTQEIDLTNMGINTVGQAFGIALTGEYAAAGISLASIPLAYMRSQQQKELSDLKLSMDQALTEKRMRESPAQAYATSYGLQYLDYAEKGAGIMLEMPNDVNSTFFQNFGAEFGYPAEKIGIETVKAGYWQGKLINNADNTTIAHGPMWDRLNEDYMKGLKLKVI